MLEGPQAKGNWYGVPRCPAYVEFLIAFSLEGTSAQGQQLSRASQGVRAKKQAAKPPQGQVWVSTKPVALLKSYPALNGCGLEPKTLVSLGKDGHTVLQIRVPQGSRNQEESPGSRPQVSIANHR